MYVLIAIFLKMHKSESEAKRIILRPFSMIISWQKQTINFGEIFASDWDSDDLSKFYVHRSNYRCPHFDGLKPEQQLFYEYVSGIHQIQQFISQVQ